MTCLATMDLGRWETVGYGSGPREMVVLFSKIQDQI